jgi:hypothetical protein
MKLYLFLIIICVASITHKGIAQTNQSVFKKYDGQYTFDQQGRINSDVFTITVNTNQLIYEKNGNVKTFDIVYQGTYLREVQSGVKFKYHQFYLTNKKIYILISDRKEVKHLGTFYYRIIIDGQTQLAL